MRVTRSPFSHRCRAIKACELGCVRCVQFSRDCGRRLDFGRYKNDPVQVALLHDKPACAHLFPRWQTDDNCRVLAIVSLWLRWNRDRDECSLMKAVWSGDFVALALGIEWASPDRFGAVCANMLGPSLVNEDSTPRNALRCLNMLMRRRSSTVGLVQSIAWHASGLGWTPLLRALRRGRIYPSDSICYSRAASASQIPTLEMLRRHVSITAKNVDQVLLDAAPSANIRTLRLLRSWGAGQRADVVRQALRNLVFAAGQHHYRLDGLKKNRHHEILVTNARLLISWLREPVDFEELARFATDMHVHKLRVLFVSYI